MRIKKGIILAGGNGTRLRPYTKFISKHLLPLYSRPIIYYPLLNLIQAGIKEILIIVNPNHINDYKYLFGDGSHLGIKICYTIQKNQSDYQMHLF